MADKNAPDGRPYVANGPVFASASRSWLPVVDLAVSKTGSWVLAVDRHARANGQDVLPCFVVWRPVGSDDVLQGEGHS